MSDDGIISAKCQMLDLFCKLDDAELDTIEQWICNHSYMRDLENKRLLMNSDTKLAKIGDALKKLVPFEAKMPSENITPPTVGDQADCNDINTVHVDEFLYDENDVEELIKYGKLKKNYCLDCNSRNTKELIYISHSMSRQTLQYLFKVLLPSDLEGKQILDVGSRLGSVLYAGFYFSNAANIVGVEINKEFCEVQEKIISQFSMDNNRIKVIHADIMDVGDIVHSSDIIIINVLDFFVDIEKHKQMWYFFKKHIKRGSYLVCNRSMADTLGSLDMAEELVNWINICKANQLHNELFFNVEESCELFLYTVN